MANERAREGRIEQSDHMWSVVGWWVYCRLFVNGRGRAPQSAGEKNRPKITCEVRKLLNKSQMERSKI